MSRQTTPMSQNGPGIFIVLENYREERGGRVCLLYLGQDGRPGTPARPPFTLIFQIAHERKNGRAPSVGPLVSRNA